MLRVDAHEVSLFPEIRIFQNDCVFILERYRDRPRKLLPSIQFIQRSRALVNNNEFRSKLGMGLQMLHTFDWPIKGFACCRIGVMVLGLDPPGKESPPDSFSVQSLVVHVEFVLGYVPGRGKIQYEEITFLIGKKAAVFRNHDFMRRPRHFELVEKNKKEYCGNCKFLGMKQAFRTSANKIQHSVDAWHHVGDWRFCHRKRRERMDNGIW